MSVETPVALFDAFQIYIDKWTGPVEGTDRTDEEVLTALIKANLRDKIDVASYRME